MSEDAWVAGVAIGPPAGAKRKQRLVHLMSGQSSADWTQFEEQKVIGDQWTIEIL
jgi:hypothetical protein